MTARNVQSKCPDTDCISVGSASNSSGFNEKGKRSLRETDISVGCRVAKISGPWLWFTPPSCTAHINYWAFFGARNASIFHRVCCFQRSAAATAAAARRASEQCSPTKCAGMPQGHDVEIKRCWQQERLVKIHLQLTFAEQAWNKSNSTSNHSFRTSDLLETMLPPYWLSADDYDHDVHRGSLIPTDYGNVQENILIYLFSEHDA